MTDCSDHAPGDWLAFRYVAGELSPVEEVAFEDELAREQAAREAVARAVELAAAVSLACRSSAAVDVGPSRPALPATPWRNTATLLATTAALLVVLIPGGWFVRDLAEGDRLSFDSARPALALAWTETSQQWDELPALNVFGTGDLDDASEDPPLAGDDVSESWIAVAVGGLEAGQADLGNQEWVP